MTYFPPNASYQLLSGQNMWEKPSVPNALDDEFEAAALAGWDTVTGFGAALNFGTAPDPYTAGAVHRAATAQSRSAPGGGGSWLKMQLLAGAGNGGIQKSLGALPANQLVWARLHFNWRNAVAPTVLDMRVGLSVFETGQMAATIPLNGVNVFLEENDRDPSAPAIAPGMWARDSGVGFVDLSWGAEQNEVASNDAYGGMAGYVAIQKLGNFYHGWVAHSETGWLYMGEVENTSGFAWDSVAVWGNNAVSTGPAEMIVGVDFVRVVNSAVFLP